MTGVPLDEVVHFDEVTQAADRSAVDADSTPTFSVFEEATDTPILADQNFTKRTSLTGNYRGAFTASAANGFEVGKWYNVVSSATVDGVAGKKKSMTFRVCPAEEQVGVPVVDFHYMEGTGLTPTTHTVDEVYDALAVVDGNVDAILDDTGTSGVVLATDQTWTGLYALNSTGQILKNLNGRLPGTGTLSILSTSDLTDAVADLPTNAELATALDALPTAAENAAAVLTTQMTESYNADGTAPTLAQAVFVIMQTLTEKDISGTTLTVKKLDGSTTALTLTLNDATTPTGVTRSG